MLYCFILINLPTLRHDEPLFKEAASQKLGKNIAQDFRELLGEDDKFEWGLEQLPTLHHDNYSKVLNDKVDKYSYLRSEICNTGIVHFFNLGDSTNGIFENQDKFFTMLDYLHFYTKLESHSPTKDLIVAEKYLMKEITTKKPKNPFLIFIKRDSQVPILFLMLHVMTHKEGKRFDFGLMMVNTNLKVNSQSPNPIHQWIVHLAFNSNSVSTDIECEGTFKINVLRDRLPFRKN